MKFIGRLFQMIWNILDFKFGAQGIVQPPITFHLNQVDNPVEFVFLTNGQCDRMGISVQPITHLRNGSEIISSYPVHFVYESDPRHSITGGLAPYRFRLRFNSLHCAKYTNSAVEHTK